MGQENHSTVERGTNYAHQQQRLDAPTDTSHSVAAENSNHFSDGEAKPIGKEVIPC
jgi:hypothetical protein